MASLSEKDSSLSPDKKEKSPALRQLLKPKNLLAVADKAKEVMQRQRDIEEDIEEENEILPSEPEWKEDKEKSVEKFIKDSISKKVKQVPIRLIDLSPESPKLITRWELEVKLVKKLDEFYDEQRNDPALWATITKEKIEEKIDLHLRYAILSHRWNGVEPNFQRANKNFSSWWSTPGEDDPGVFKLVQFCRKAQSKGIHLAWSDTCCIDKLSARDLKDPEAPSIDPAELPESLNSMFQWYRGAELCIVYMAETTSWSDVEKKKDWEDRWFTRGWTLQELLAPKVLKFYTQEWEELIQGSANDKHIGRSEDDQVTELGKVVKTVLQSISKKTGIDMAQIQDFRPEDKGVPMRQRMIWASERETGKDEDIAYCLMGIFDVGMDIRYGEGGEEAFYRLQEQIIKRHRDDSLFNWYGQPSVRSTVMASHPRCFNHKHDETIAKKLQPYRFNEQSFLTRLFCACTGITCMNACMTQMCSCAVRIDVVIHAGEIINQAESHFDVTNNGLRIKVDTTRVLYMYSLPPKKRNHRRYLYLAGHERVKVMFTQAMKEEIYGQPKGRREFVVIPLGTEGDTSQGERLPRIALLLYKVGNNVWKRVRTVEPIVLKRTKVKLVNENLLRTIYIS